LPGRSPKQSPSSNIGDCFLASLLAMRDPRLSLSRPLPYGRLFMGFGVENGPGMG
jgi:hypothetical protein